MKSPSRYEGTFFLGGPELCQSTREPHRFIKVRDRKRERRGEPRRLSARKAPNFSTSSEYISRVELLNEHFPPTLFWASCPEWLEDG